MNYEIHPIAEIFPRMSGEEFVALKQDIKERGLLEPICLYEGKVLDGRHRYYACQETGSTPEFREYEGDDPVGFVRSLNLNRRHLSDGAKAISAAKADEWYRTLANERKIRGGLASVEAKGRSADQVAKDFGTSGPSVERARSVLKTGDDSLVEAVQSGKVSVSAAADVATLPKEEQKEIVARGEREILEAAKAIRIQKAEARKVEIAAIKAANPLLIPEGRYSCIVIDPPWEMQKIERDVRQNQVEFDYPTMTEQELAAFDVDSMAADDCHLFCWTTHKHLPQALRLLDAWGFRYVLTMVWHKAGGFQPFGLPQYNCEFCLYARKGTPEFVDTKQFFACFEAPRREHSRKPDVFYDVIRRVTDGPRIDVFSREVRDGFAQFGNETERFAA